MPGTVRYAGERLSRLAGQMRHLPRTLALVRQASGRLIYLWAALLVLQGLLPVAIVYLTRDIVNALVEAIRSGAQWSALRPVVVFALAIGAVMFATQLLRSATLWVRTAQSEMVKDFITGLIQRKSLEVDLAFYDSCDFYDHLHRARVEASYRPVELLEALGSVLQGGITALAVFAILLPYGPILPLALLLSATPVFFVALRMAQRRHHWHQQSTAEQRRAWYYDSLLTESESAAEVRLFDLGDLFSQAYESIRARLRSQWIALARKENISEIWAGAMALLVLGAAMAWMSWQAIRGRLSLGDLALFYQAFNQAMGISRTMLENLGHFYENSLFLGNLFEFLDMKPKVVSPAAGRAVPSPLRRGLRFEAVSFRYPGSQRLALDNFNLEIRPGETVALVGPNGMGKSTLVRLLCRFYDPLSGSITLDGVPLGEFSLPELRRAISVFFQQPVDYSETLADNIRFGDLRIPDPKFAAAMRRAAILGEVDEIAARLPEGYQTQLGRGYLQGAGLSTGEWRRLALARALLRQAPILILDEPTGAMDPWAELKWAEGMRKTGADRITILITHRFTTAVFADLIHVVSNGRIVESGSHVQLMAQGGVYAQGWSAQASA